MKNKNLFLTAIATINFTLLIMAQVPTIGLVAHYPFTGNANDITTNANNGVVHSATLTTDRFGTPNAAYSFNGTNSYIEVINGVNLNNNDYTYSFWIKFNTIPSSSNASNFFELGSQDFSGGHYGQLFSVNNNYNATTGWRVTSGNANFTVVGFQNGTLPSANVWYHYTITRNDSIVKLYIDCQNIMNGVTNGLLPYYKSPLDVFFGCRADLTLNQYLDGTMDDIRIYNRALSPTEITALCNEGLCFQNITVTDTLMIHTNFTGFSPITYENTIKVFPNPTKDHVTINYGNFSSMTGYTLKITNSLGQTVFTSPINLQQSYLDLSTWGGNGIYFVHVIDAHNNTIDIKKIVLQ